MNPPPERFDLTERAVTARALAVRTLRGRSPLSDLRNPLNDLHCATGTPVTGRLPWLQAWADSYVEHEPCSILVEAEGGRVEAAALLALRRRFGILDVVGLGHGPSDYLRLPARDVEMAKVLARALVDFLHSLRRPWRMRIEQLPVGDMVARHVIAMLDATLLPGVPSPRICFGDDRSLRSYANRSFMGNLNTARNRLAREGLVPVVRHTRDPDEIERLLPAMALLRQERDRELLRTSTLDGDASAAFRRRLILGHAVTDEVEVSTLTLGGALAAYAVCFLDGNSYRFWEGRVSPTATRFSAGHLVVTAAIEKALGNGAINEFDWMRGEEPHKMRASNDSVPAEHLAVCAPAAVGGLLEAPSRLRPHVVRWCERYGMAEPVKMARLMLLRGSRACRLGRR